MNMEQEPGAAPRTGTIRMEATNATQTYCNFAVAQDSPEEVVLNLGVRQHWNADEHELRVKVLQQVIMTPATARRLKDALVQLFERRDARAKPRSETVA